MRRALFLLVGIAVVAGTVPAYAESDWDPDDVESPLDLRWTGARFTPDDRIVLVLSFYDDFRPRALPRHKDWDDPGVHVTLSAVYHGLLFRRSDERIVFFYGDTGSSCCLKAVARQPSADVLKVVLLTLPAGIYPYRVQAFSSWYDEDNELVRDRTGILELGMPPDS